MSLAVTESVIEGLVKSMPNSSSIKATLFLEKTPLGIFAKSSKATPSVKLRLYATILTNVSKIFDNASVFINVGCTLRVSGTVIVSTKGLVITVICRSDNNVSLS